MYSEKPFDHTPKQLTMSWLTANDKKKLNNWNGLVNWEEKNLTCKTLQVDFNKVNFEPWNYRVIKKNWI